jgi:hypothetical protein
VIAGESGGASNPLEGGPWWAYLIGAAITTGSVVLPVYLSRKGHPAPASTSSSPGTEGPVTQPQGAATDAEIALIRELVQGLQEDKTRLMGELEALRLELNRRQGTIDQLTRMMDSIAARQDPMEGRRLLGPNG